MTDKNTRRHTGEASVRINSYQWLSFYWRSNTFNIRIPPRTYPTRDCCFLFMHHFFWRFDVSPFSLLKWNVYCFFLTKGSMRSVL